MTFEKKQPWKAKILEFFERVYFRVSDVAFLGALFYNAKLLVFYAIAFALLVWFFLYGIDKLRGQHCIASWTVVLIAGLSIFHILERMLGVKVMKSLKDDVFGWKK